MPASAATSSGNSPLGFWNSYAYITVGKDKGGPYPNPTTITSYDPATGAFSGTDTAWDIGLETITGTLNSDGTLTYTIDNDGVELNGQGKVEFYPDGSATWTGTWSNSIGQSGTVHATLKNPTLSGTVEAIACGETSCNPPSGLAGQPILVRGTSSDGWAVSVSATSDADGAWSVSVPSGNYDVGPTSDGKTIGMATFDPDLVQKSVASTDISGVDFMTCAESANDTELTDSVSPALAGGNGALSAHRVVYRKSSYTASLCKSEYTVTVSAQIPQKQIVDPSTIAPYDKSTDPEKPKFAAETSGLATLFYQHGLDSVFEHYPRYPSCPSLGDLEHMAQFGYELRWYTYLSGGSLGQVTIPLVWNQRDKTVYFNGAPSETSGSLTRTWVYQYVGHSTTISCPVTAPVSAVYYVVPGGSDRRHLVNDNAFTIVVLWYIPFAAVGETVAPNTSAELALKKVFGEEVGGDLVETWEHLPWLARFGAVASLGGLGGKALQGAELAATELPSAIKASEDVIEALKVGSNVYEKLDHSHILYDATMAGWSGIFSLLNKGYPVMGAVIRGSFHTEWESYSTPELQYAKSTTLGVSVKSTAFPDITLQIARNAKDSQGSTGPCKKVYEGVLPWAETPVIVHGCPTTTNPFAAYPPYFIAHTTKQYPSGKQAVKEILAATNQLGALGTAMRDTASLSANFGKEQALVKAPICDPSTGKASTPSTFCWVFEDGRP